LHCAASPGAVRAIDAALQVKHGILVTTLHPNAPLKKRRRSIASQSLQEIIKK
jgi:hypothetical protein